MTQTIARAMKRQLGPVAALTLGLALLPATLGQMYDPPAASVGGIDPRPFLLSIARTQDVATVTWQGLHGPYQVVEQQSVGGAWQPVGDQTSGTSAQVPVGTDNGFLQVAAPNPNYLGARDCRFCHKSIHETWTNTVHAQAFTTLKNIGMDKNSQCLPVTSLATDAQRLSDEATTPWLAGAQCENCHGPAGTHAENF
jgi:hypothetical protein